MAVLSRFHTCINRAVTERLCHTCEAFSLLLGLDLQNNAVLLGLALEASDMNPRWRRQILLTFFAVAMAYVEATVVVYLRQVHYPENLLVIFPPMILSEPDLVIELAREVATVVMILAVALLSAKGLVAVFAVFVYVFGLWDIFYYFWLKATIGWPVSWTEWDILFLIPWAWLGPWITAAAIALLFALWGGRVLAQGGTYHFPTWAAISFVVGSLLTVAAFLQPAVPYISGGLAAFAEFQPNGFWWPLYLAGYVLMALGLFLVLRMGERPQQKL